jgi:hypothetical protein
MAEPAPLLRWRGVVVRASWSLRPCWRNADSSWSLDREQDHVVAEARRHELETPKPNHRGVRKRRGRSSHPESGGKSVKNTQDPYLARQLSVFFPRGGHTNE